MNSSFAPFGPRTRNSLITNVPAAGGFGAGDPFKSVESAGGGKTFPDSAGAAAGAEGVSKLAGAAVVELLDEVFA